MNGIAVIMAAYNRAATIKSSIESVLNQECRDSFELIIVDDGSTDGTERVVESFLTDPRVRYFKTPNQGQAQALNFGLSMTTSEYVAFIDSDDEYLPHHLSTLAGLAKTSGADFILGSFELVQCGDQNEVADFYNPGRTISIAEIECITGVIFAKREAIIKSGGFDGEFLDIGLFERMKKQSLSWQRCRTKTYRHFFGRCSGNLSRQILVKHGP